MPILLWCPSGFVTLLKLGSALRTKLKQHEAWNFTMLNIQHVLAFYYLKLIALVSSHQSLKKRNIFYSTTAVIVVVLSVMNAATETWKNGLRMMYPLTETRLPLCFSQRSLLFYSVFSLQIIIFFFVLWRTRYSTRLQRLIRLSIE